jgi:hypothetical protein
MNLWETLIDYINKKEIGEILTRTELLDINYQSSNSIDSYRNQLTQAGFLETISPGRYRKLKIIPKNIPIGLLSKAIYDKTYRGWFMNTEDRIKFYEGNKNGKI